MDPRVPTVTAPSCRPAIGELPGVTRAGVPGAPDRPLGPVRAGRPSRVLPCRTVRGCSTASSATSPPRRCRTRRSPPPARSTSRWATPPGPIRHGRARMPGRSLPTTSGRRCACSRTPGCPAPWSGSPSDRPARRAAARAAGLTVEELPLLVAADPVEMLLPAGVRLYLVGADDPELPRYQQVAASRSATPSAAGGGPRWTRRRPGSAGGRAGRPCCASVSPPGAR